MVKFQNKISTKEFNQGNRNQYRHLLKHVSLNYNLYVNSFPFCFHSFVWIIVLAINLGLLLAHLYPLSHSKYFVIGKPLHNNNYL